MSVADLPRKLARHVKVDETTGCWLWTGGINPSGYANTWQDGRTQSAHRVAYRALVGPIPDGHDIDHLCRVRRCINPLHLEPVTERENTMRSPIAPAAVNARKTHCKRGHEFTDANTRTYAGRRHCRACALLRQPEQIRSARERRQAQRLQTTS